MLEKEREDWIYMQAGRVAAARPPSAPAANAFAGSCGGPQIAAIVLRILRQPARRRVTGTWPHFRALRCAWNLLVRWLKKMAA